MQHKIGDTSVENKPILVIATLHIAVEGQIAGGRIAWGLALLGGTHVSVARPWPALGSIAD